MTQTIFRAGNSNVVAIPKSISEDLGLQKGSKVRVGQKGESIVISPVKKIDQSHGVNHKFMKMVDEFMNEHADVLEKLAKR